MSAQPERGHPARLRAGGKRSAERPAGTAAEVFWTFLRLGLTSFGGPVAHLGYFRAECVERCQWLDEHSYADIVALCQFLPGPASSQVGMGLGILRAGLPGALAAWLGFTMPSALAMILFGYGVNQLGNMSGAPWLHGLKIVAVAVVAQAVWGMARSLAPDRERATIAVAAAILAQAVPTAFGQVGAIVAGGVLRLLVAVGGIQDQTRVLGTNGWGDTVNGVGAFMVETLLTFLLVAVVLLTTRSEAAPGFAGLAIGLALTVIHLVGIPLTGTSVNPARSIGPALFEGGTAVVQLWLFVLAPLLGAVLAAGVVTALTDGDRALRPAKDRAAAGR
jgi:chromate transporter